MADGKRREGRLGTCRQSEGTAPTAESEISFIGIDFNLEGGVDPLFQTRRLETRLSIPTTRRTRSAEMPARFIAQIYSITPQKRLREGIH